MHLIEIYKSVQGESSFAGLPCIFVRLAGCNLRCTWCDSEYTFTGGKKMLQEEVEAEVARLSMSKLSPCKLVEITGGEPMLQERELIPFMEKLLADGYTVLIETSGERPLANVPKAVHKIVDVKCPQSGEGGTFNLANLDALTQNDEVKFVLTGREDYEFARGFIQQQQLEKKCGHILLSPAFRKDASPERTADNCLLDPRKLTEWMLEDGVPARISLQIHKFIWPPQQKGV
jgi:7-carboxy-7-deazaguanine synthase